MKNKYTKKTDSSNIVEESIIEDKRKKFNEVLEKCFGAWRPEKDLGDTRAFIRSLRKDRKFKW